MLLGFYIFISQYFSNQFSLQKIIFKKKNQQTKTQQESLTFDEQHKNIKEQKSSSTYSAVTAISMLINTAVGTGMLNLPNKIARASITTSFIQYLCGQHLLDVIQRTHLIMKYEELQQKVLSSKRPDDIQIQTTTEIATESKKDDQKQKDVEDDIIEGDTDFKLDVNQPMPNTQLSCSFLCEKYYGKVGFYIYQIASALLIFFTNVSYTNVTASSLSSIIPIKSLLKDGEEWVCDTTQDFKKESCDISYWIYVGVICAVALCLMWFDLSSQSGLQNFFTLCRLGVLALVCIVTIYCLITTPYLSQEQYKSHNYVYPDIDYASFNFKYFSQMASSLTFSLIYHHGIPMILQPVKDTEQSKLQVGFVINSVILIGLTILITLPAALYFGPDSIDLVTLNFTSWNGKDFSGGKSTVFATIIKYTMRILPPLYIIFCIPVRGLIMSGNLLELFSEKQRAKKWLQPVLNICCIIPSVLIGGFFKDLSVIINFTSIFGYVAIFVGEPLLIKCNIISKKYNIPSKFSWFNKSWIAYILLCWVLFSVIFTLYSLIA